MFPAPLATGGVVATDFGCGASVVEVAFGLLRGVAAAVAGGVFSVCSVRVLPDLPDSFFSFSLLPEEELRGAMLFPLSEGEPGVCVGCAASAGAALRKSASAVVYRTFFMGALLNFFTF